MEMNENDIERISITRAKEKAVAIYLDDSLIQNFCDGFPSALLNLYVRRSKLPRAILQSILHHQLEVVMNRVAWDAL